MTREAIRLDPDKVRFYIANKGIPIKQLLDGMTAKTVHRIKAGKNTSPATANKLATKLGVTVDDLSSPLKAEEMESFLPDLWLYDNVDEPSGIGDEQFVPCSGAFDGFDSLMDQSPTDMLSPISKLLDWIQRPRKIVLRRSEQAFILEIHYFCYSPDHMQTVEYNLATACRFFPLLRKGDNFKKAALNDWADRYIWNHLQETALANAEIVTIEGYDYPDNPSTYFPLVRFYHGIGINRMALGARIFVNQIDLRASLLGYLENVPASRVSASSTASGIAMTVEPSYSSAAPDPNWWVNELKMKINLAWRMPDGKLAVAPWRQTSREKFIKGILSRDWREMHLEHMPRCIFSQNNADEDAEPPLFEADPCLSAETFAAVDGRDHPVFF